MMQGIYSLIFLFNFSLSVKMKLSKVMTFEVLYVLFKQLF